MRIPSSGIVQPRLSLVRPAPEQRQAAKPGPQPAPEGPDLSASDCRKVLGSVGAMAGALTGRTLASGAVAAAAGLTAGAFGLGPIAIGAASLVGLAAGVKLELSSKLGRLGGGLIGGALGSTVGWVGDLAGFDTSERMRQECKGFSVTSLPGKLLNPNYTSHKKLIHHPEKAAEGMALARPGDIIITNNDENFKLELLQKVAGATGNWTHTFLVDTDGSLIDILQEDNQPRRTPLRTAFEENEHVMILRPDYPSDEARDRGLAWSRSQFGKVTYDAKFDLETKDAVYCQEYLQYALEKADPSLPVEPMKAFGFKPLITADQFIDSPKMEEVWSSGSNFWENWLSHFN